MNTELHAKWQDYLFLTQEMKKFLVKRELDMFFSLLEQRQTMQTELEKYPDKGYYTLPEGKCLLLQIQQENQKMMTQFHTVFNGMKKQESVSQAYEGMSNFAGSFINNRT
jgi:hypothetical protein